MSDLQILDALLNAQNIAQLLDANGSGILIRTSEHRKPTFRYAGTYTPVATPTDTLIIKGSATKTLRLKHIILTGVATAAGTMSATLIRRSSADSGGTGVLNAVTPAVHDVTNDGSATGTVSTVGTGNFGALGTSVGTLGQRRLFFAVAATFAPAPVFWEFARLQDKAVLLRGVSDFICLNLNGGAVPTTGSIDFEIEIEEDAN